MENCNNCLKEINTDNIYYEVLTKVKFNNENKTFEDVYCSENCIAHNQYKNKVFKVINTTINKFN